MKFLPLLLLLFAFAAPAGTQVMDKSLKEELVYRVSMGKVDDVALLLEHLGGNPNITDEMGWPLLAVAASRSDEEALPMVKYLVEHGADVNYHGGRMNYPIMFAVQSGNADIVKYLLDKEANYRVTDPYGVKLVDFARQSRDKEVLAIIEKAVNEDVLNLARVRSQSYLDEITYDLAFHACAMQYYTYYYNSGQDTVAKSIQNATIAKHKEIIGRSIGELTGLFRLPRSSATMIFEKSRVAMFDEMESMISNRWRRSKGVGKPGDMEERCTRLSEPWKEGVFDKEILDQNL